MYMYHITYSMLPFPIKYHMYLAMVSYIKLLMKYINQPTLDIIATNYVM